MDHADLALRRKTILSTPREFIARPGTPIPEEYMSKILECEARMQELIAFGEKRTKEIQEMLNNIYLLESRLPVAKGKIITTVI